MHYMSALDELLFQAHWVDARSTRRSVKRYNDQYQELKIGEESIEHSTGPLQMIQ